MPLIFLRSTARTSGLLRYPTGAAALQSCCAKRSPALSEHIEADGVTVFNHACRLGLEGSYQSALTRPIAQVERSAG